MLNKFKKISPFHIFYYEGDFILIATNNLSAIPIRPNIAKRLQEYNIKDESDFIKKNFVILNRYGLLPNTGNKNSVKKNRIYPSPITHLTLFVAQQCNLNCIYCYGNGGKYGNAGLMKYKTAISAVDWLISQSNKKNKLGISFFGGEPLLNFSLIKKIVDYAKLQGEKHGKKFEFGITTNATLLNKKIISFFNFYNIVPIVSFDGTEEYQNNQRPFKNGKGSYDAVYKNLQELLKTIPNSVCRATIIEGSDHNIVEKKIQEIGFKHIQLTIVSPTLFNDKIDFKRDINSIFESIRDKSLEIINFTKNRNADKLKKTKNSGLGWHLCRMIEQYINNQKRYFSCGAGRSGVAIAANGEVYLCHRFVGLREFRLGNVLENNIKRNIFQKSPIRYNKECMNCFAKYFCAGGCYHDNLGMTGSIFSPANDMCLFMRNLSCYAGLVSCRLKSKDIAFLNKEGILSKKTCLLDLF